MDVLVSPSARSIAEQQAELFKRMSRVERGLSAVQLGSSSLEGSGVDIYDNSGTFRGRWGVQPDSSVSFTSVNNPVPPPVPSSPIVVPDISTLTVGHNGQTETGEAWPTDVTFLRVYAQPTAQVGTSEPTAYGTISPFQDGSGSTVIGPLDPTEWSVWVTAVNMSGKESDKSLPATGTPTQVVSQVILDGAITELKLAANAVTEATLKAGAVTETKIAPDSIASPQIKAGGIMAVNIAANQITGGHLVADSITAREILALSITANELAANAITAGKILTGAIEARHLTANLILATRIICGTATGNRVELHPTQGVQGWSKDGTFRSFWIDAQTGDVVITGRLFTGITGERAIMDTDGTLTFVDVNNTVSGKIINDGTSGLIFRARYDAGSNTAWLFLSRTTAYIAYGQPGVSQSSTPASFAVDNAGVQSWGRLVGIRYEQRFAGDGTQPRLFILGTESNGSDSGLSTLHFIKRASPGNREPVIIATGQACGLMFENGAVAATNGNGFSYGSFRAASYITSSSEEFKTNVATMSDVDGRSSWDMIEATPVFDFHYRDDKAPPEYATDSEGNPVLARIRNPELTEKQFEELSDDDPRKWNYEKTPLRHVKDVYKRRKHRFPIAEDLKAIDPEFVTDDGGVDLRDMLGMHHDAIDKLIKYTRTLERLLIENVPSITKDTFSQIRPQKGDVVAGIGSVTPGRTKRGIDGRSGQGKRYRHPTRGGKISGSSGS